MKPIFQKPIEFSLFWIWLEFLSLSTAGQKNKDSRNNIGKLPQRVKMLLSIPFQLKIMISSWF